MTDNVNHPKHYTQGCVECIDALAAATINLKGLDAVCTANAIKYLWRWGQKNGVEDLKKPAGISTNWLKKMKSLRIKTKMSKTSPLLQQCV